MEDKILSIETSCDETSVAIVKGYEVLSNEVYHQKEHIKFGGVIPEVASREHLKKICFIIDKSLKNTNITINQIGKIAYTKGPGLMGSLMVGSNFAKGLAIALDIPLIEVNHIQAHIHSLLINDNLKVPTFPFICLVVSGGHTQLVLVNSEMDMKILGSTLDDAVGEAFDKTASMLGLEYPGGPLLDKYAKLGKPLFKFSKSKLKDYNFSFSGLKTSVKYFLKEKTNENKDFIKDYFNDICASIQQNLVEELFNKTVKVANFYNLDNIGIVGGVSANSLLRLRFNEWAVNTNGNIFFPKFEYCTDNAAMVGVSAYIKSKYGIFGNLESEPFTKKQKLFYE